LKRRAEPTCSIRRYPGLLLFQSLFSNPYCRPCVGCQTAHQDYNRRMASAADGSLQPAPGLDVRLLVDNMPMLAWSSHADGSLDFVNQQWRDYTGLSTEESHGPGWKAAVHPDDLPGLLQHWETQPELDHAGEHEVRLRRSDGVFRWFSIRREPLQDEAGALLRWYGTAADIENRKQADALRAAEKRSRTNSRDVLWNWRGNNL